MTAQRILATFALLGLLGSAHATRVLEQPERPYELSLAQLTLPSSAGGGLTVKPCADCPYSTHALTATTTYWLNGQRVAYADFRRVAEELRENRTAADTALAGVFVDVDTGRVNRVTLQYRGL